MINPTYPSNVSEIPDITFSAIKYYTSLRRSKNVKTLGKEGVATTTKCSQERNSTPGFTTILKDCGVDHIKLNGVKNG